MLEQLLTEIKQGSALDTNAMARKLGVSPRQIIMMLEDLERMGRIHRKDACSENGCATCSVASFCQADKSTPTLWMYTGD